MSHERDGRVHIFTCDECGESEEDSGDFAEVWAELKSDGWRAFRDRDGQWEHRCHACSGWRAA